MTKELDQGGIIVQQEIKVFKEDTLRTLYLRDLTFHGSTVLDPQVTIDLVKYIETGQIKPCLAATFKLHELREAQETFIAKKHTGNIVVTT